MIFQKNQKLQNFLKQKNFWKFNFASEKLSQLIIKITENSKKIQKTRVTNAKNGAIKYAQEATENCDDRVIRVIERRADSYKLHATSYKNDEKKKNISIELELK